MSPRSAAPFALLAAVGALIGCARKPPEAIKPSPPLVTVTYPVVRMVRDYEDFAGRTEPVKIVELRARVSGYLTKIYFKDGQDIEGGKPLFDIDDRTYKAELDTALAALANAQARLVQAKANEARVQEGYDKGVNSVYDRDAAISALAVTEADIKSAKAAIEKASTNLEFCKISSPFSGRLSKHAVDEGNLVKADDTMLTTIVFLKDVYATFEIDERTVIRLLKLVQHTEATEKDLTREQVQSVIGWIQGTRVEVAQADDDENTIPLSGPVTFVDNQIDVGTGTLRVRATMTNTELKRPPWYRLMPGQFVRVRLPIGPPRDAVLVPEKAIGSDQGQRYVFVVGAGNVVERRDVIVGQQHGTFRVVESVEKKNEITPADRIIVEGLLRVRPGSEVSPKPYDAPKPKDAASPAPAPPAPPAPQGPATTAAPVPQAPNPHAKQ
jgi:membrane fusion protein, multidrug efflux system